MVAALAAATGYPEPRRSPPLVHDVVSMEAYVDALSDEETLRLHRIVCRRAALIYEVHYRGVRDRNFERAMSVRDTRFVRGLAPMDNVRRIERQAREHPHVRS